MKFLRIILIGSLTLSAASPCYSSPWQPLFNWWGSQPPKVKFLVTIYGCCFIGVACCLGLLWRESRTRNTIKTISDIVTDLVAENNAQARQEHEMQQLRKIIASGYRVTTDPILATSSALHSSTHSFLMLAIHNKPYLIPLLKELGATPDKIEVDAGVNPLTYCLGEAAKEISSQAFNTLLENYPLSEDQWDAFIERVAMFFDIWYIPCALANIIPSIPARLVNNAYPFSEYNARQPILHYLIRELSQGLSHYIPLIQQLLDKGADPLIPDANGKTVLDLVSNDITDSVEKRNVKKQLKDLLMSYIKNKKEARIATADGELATINPLFNHNLVKLCSDYEYDTVSDRLLDLLNNDHDEKEILSKLQSIIESGDAYETSYGTTYIVNKADANGVTPLMYAATRGHCSVVQYLMDHGADIEACDKKDHNVLRHAAYHGQSSVIKTVLEQAKKDGKLTPRLIDKQDNYWGETPLINAIRTSSSPKKVTAKMKEDTVRVLLEYGADTTLQSFNKDAAWYAGGCIMEDEHNVADSSGARDRVIAMLKNPPRLAADTPPAASPGLGLDKSV